MEGAPESKNNQPEELSELHYDLESYIAGINRVYEIVNITSDMPLSANPQFKFISEEIKRDIYPLARELFKMARSSTGHERLKYAQALAELKLLSDGKYDEVLSTIPTNKMAVTELLSIAYEETNDNPDETLKDRILRKAKKLFKK
jgi:hypothetical protein